MRPRRRAAAALVAIALGWPAMVGAAATNVAPADAVQPARRDIAWVPGATCDVTTAAALAARHSATRQFVIVSADR